MSLESDMMQRPEFADLSKSYGPGKFNTWRSAYLYELSLEGADSECGDCETSGHHALVRGPFENPQLAYFVGAIVITDYQGFVSTVVYTVEAAMLKDWEAVEAYCATFETEEA